MLPGPSTASLLSDDHCPPSLSWNLIASSPVASQRRTLQSLWEIWSFCRRTSTTYTPWPHHPLHSGLSPEAGESLPSFLQGLLSPALHLGCISFCLLSYRIQAFVILPSSIGNFLFFCGIAHISMQTSLPKTDKHRNSLAPLLPPALAPFSLISFAKLPPFLPKVEYTHLLREARPG